MYALCYTAAHICFSRIYLKWPSNSPSICSVEYYERTIASWMFWWYNIHGAIVWQNRSSERSNKERQFGYKKWTVNWKSFLQHQCLPEAMIKHKYFPCKFLHKNMILGGGGEGDFQTFARSTIIWLNLS